MSRFDLPPVVERLGFSEEHELGRQAARRFLNERCPMREIRRLTSDPAGHDPALHRQTAELGWLGLTASQAHGGAGLGHLHLALLLEEMGRVLWPAPFFPGVLALGALELAGDTRFSAAIAGGDRVAAVALDGELDEVTAEPTDGGFVLNGRKSHVTALQHADVVLTAAREPSGGAAVFALELPCPGLDIEPEVSVDTTRRSARLLLDGARVARAARLDGDGTSIVHTTTLRGAALLACEMIGAADAVLERTRVYAIERRQFGRAIGSFQAVKHPIVDTLCGVELGRSLALAAATLFDQGVVAAETTARMAKAMAGDVLSTAVKRGVQLHGGFGFTWDCDVHFFFKRALWARATLGDSIHHRSALAHALLD